MNLLSALSVHVHRHRCLVYGGESPRREILVVIAMANCLCLLLIAILFSVCSASLPAAEAGGEATPTAGRISVTEPVRDGRSSSLSRTPSACRLMPRNADLSNRVRQMASDGSKHLIKYALQFPDGWESNITGTM